MRTTFVLAAIAATASTGLASDDLFISYNNPNTDIGLGGGTFIDDEVIRTNPGATSASSFFNLGQDLNAFHIDTDGSYLVSGLFNFTLGGTTWQDGDLVRYNPLTDTAVAIFGDAQFGNTSEDVDAVSVHSDGRILFSTLADAQIASQNLTFGEGDIMAYDAVSGVFSLFISAADIFDDGAGDLSGLHSFGDGRYLITSNADEMISGFMLQEGSIALWDSNTDTASLYFDGRNLTDTMGSTLTPELDAIYLVPAPMSAGLLGLAGLATSRRRR